MTRIGEQLAAHQIELALQRRAFVPGEFERDELADAHVFNVGVTQLVQRFFDGLALRVEKRGLERDMNFGK